MSDERLQFLEWKNEKAILLQKIQIQEMFIQESKEREQNLRKMNETFINTLNLPQGDNVVVKFQKSFEQTQIEEQQEVITQMQNKVKQLEDKLNDKDNQIKIIMSNNKLELQRLQNKKNESEQEKENCNNNCSENSLQKYQKLQQEFDKMKCYYEQQMKQKNNDSDILREKIIELEDSNEILRKQYSQQQQKIQSLIKSQESLKLQILELNESQQINQNHQSPSYPTTRIRTSQQIRNNTTITSNNNLEGQIKDIQNKLYNVKKKLTTTTEQENSFIRSSIQKIKYRSRNHSISMNDTTIYIDDKNSCDDQVEYKTNQTYQTNQSLMCNGFKFN